MSGLLLKPNGFRGYEGPQRLMSSPDTMN